MLRAVDEGYGHLIGIAPLQFRVAVDINYPVRLPGFGADCRHLSDRLVTQMAALPSENNDSLRLLGEVDHVSIFPDVGVHDAGDAISDAWRVRRPIRLMANRTAPLICQTLERMAVHVQGGNDRQPGRTMAAFRTCPARHLSALFR